MAEVCLERGRRLEMERWCHQELSLGHSKLTFAQANRQAMGSAQVQYILEILNMS